MNDLIMPPKDKEAEKAVLGCALRSKTALVDLMPMLQVDDFYHYAHQKVWEAFQRLLNKGRNIDSVILFDELREMKADGDVLPAYLVEIWDGAPSIGNHAHYAAIVKGMAQRRGLIEAAARIDTLARDLGQSPDEAIEQAEAELFRATQRDHGGTELVTMPEAVRAALEDLERRARHAGDELPTGLIDLDKLTGGLKRKELMIVGARPSVGKTLFALNLIEHLARLGKRIFFASIEQSSTELIERMLVRNTAISSYFFRRATFTPDQQTQILKASDALDEYQLFIDPNPVQTAARIASQARRLAAKAPLDLVVIDYLGLMDAEDRHAQRYIQIGTNCRRMKQLAKELNSPVMLLAQLGRQADNRSDKSPKLSDLRESGDIEQHADTVLLLHKEQDPDDEDNRKSDDELYVLVKKQRNGPRGNVKLIHRTQFYDLRNYAPGIPE